MDQYDGLVEYEEKEIKLMANGDSSRFIKMKISNNHKLIDIIQFLEEKWETRYRKIRLFTSQGVEIFQDDIIYMKNGSELYVSKGEDFDQNSCFSEYEIVKELGKGGFGKVVLGIHKRTNEKFAIKIVNTSMIGNALDIDLVFREAETLKSLTHKNIVKIHNCYTLSNMQVVFVMEYLEGGELLKYLNEKKYLSEVETRHFFLQIVDAISYVHKEQLIHRDLKLENLLLADKEEKIIKIVDFGIAGILSNINVDNIHAGTLKYLAPEVLEKKTNNISPGLDVWSIGCILFALLTGNLPFRGNNTKTVVEKIKNGFYLFPEEFEKNLSNEVKDLIKKCLDINPKTRITMNEISEHPWTLNDIKEKTTLTIELKPEEENKEEVKINKNIRRKKDSPRNRSGSHSSFGSNNNVFPSPNKSVFLSPKKVNDSKPLSSMKMLSSLNKKP